MSSAGIMPHEVMGHNHGYWLGRINKLQLRIDDGYPLGEYDRLALGQVLGEMRRALWTDQQLIDNAKQELTLYSITKRLTK